jgi:hypothetical protein
MRRYLLIALIGAMYLPTFRTIGVTSMGSIETSDYLIFPAIFMMAISARRRYHSISRPLFKWVVLFLLWSFLGSLLINPRYGYIGTSKFFFSFIKLAKFTVYIFAGTFLWGNLQSSRNRNLHLLLVLLSAHVDSWSLIILSIVGTPSLYSSIGYENTNANSVLISSTFCYLAAIWAGGLKSRRLKYVILFTLLTLLVGAFVSKGRGGWLSIVSGGLYLVYEKKTISRRIGFVILLIFLTAVVMYHTNQRFNEQFNSIFMTDPSYKRHALKHQAGIAGVDDGRRLTTWKEEGVHFVDAPFFGTGFFHRAGKTNLMGSGSHNYFLQIYLETGIVGGTLLLFILWRMWRLSSSSAARHQQVSLPVRAALISAIIGAMGGEYFYGGITLFNIILLFGAVGSLPRSKFHSFESVVLSDKSPSPPSSFNDCFVSEKCF